MLKLIDLQNLWFLIAVYRFKISDVSGKLRNYEHKYFWDCDFVSREALITQTGERERQG